MCLLVTHPPPGYNLAYLLDLLDNIMWQWNQTLLDLFLKVFQGVPFQKKNMGGWEGGGLPTDGRMRGHHSVVFSRPRGLTQQSFHTPVFLYTQLTDSWAAPTAPSFLRMCPQVSLAAFCLSTRGRRRRVGEWARRRKIIWSPEQQLCLLEVVLRGLRCI